MHGNIEFCGQVCTPAEQWSLWRIDVAGFTPRTDRAAGGRVYTPSRWCGDVFEQDLHIWPGVHPNRWELTPTMHDYIVALIRAAQRKQPTALVVCATDEEAHIDEHTMCPR